MNKEEKIFIKKDEDIDEVLSAVKNSKADKVILNIPKGSILKSSLDNFHTLKRESLQADKDLLIESTDPHIEELADLAKIDSINPVFGQKERFVSDIIPRGKMRKKSKKKDSGKSKNDFLSKGFGKKKSKSKKSSFSFSLPRFLKRKKSKKSSSSFLGKLASNWLTILITLIVLAGLYYVGFYMMPKADIMITLERNSVPIDHSVRVDTNTADVSLTSEDNIDFVLPGEIISSSMNNELKFTASGQGEVERRASGQINIFNEYGEDSLTLVDETRFRTSDGQVFILEEAVTVPGAELGENGSVVELGQVEADIVASEPGEEYNIDTSSDETWNIPGFQEAGLTDMYEGFYGKPQGSMTGGLIGNTRHPTDEDIENALNSIEESLRASLQSQMLITDSSDFKTIDQASQFEIVSQNVNQEVDEEGQFSVFAEASLRNFAFRAGDLENVLIENVVDESYPVEIVRRDLSYENVNINWEEGVMTFDLTGQVTTKPKLDREQLRSDFAGKSRQQLEPVINDIPNLKNAKASLWPFWVKDVPVNTKKINIAIE